MDDTGEKRTPLSGAPAGREKTFGPSAKIGRKDSEKLEDTLNAAFVKAFDLVFEKGTGIIEKTYNKEQQKMDYQVREYAAGLKANRKTVKAFGRQSQAARAKNLAISAWREWDLACWALAFRISRFLQPLF
ncbi:hypothetical protein [uncultured Merdimonas sp.]|uniref:hypothetical protein n=1 Tax=uncultured Merdimonas sp. TaxID=2023269 RepID=UPI00320A3531